MYQPTGAVAQPSSHQHGQSAPSLTVAPTPMPSPAPSGSASQSPRAALALFVLALSTLLPGCGGSDDTGAAASSPAPAPVPAPVPVPVPPPPPPAASTTLEGAVVKGPVAGAAVCAYTVVASGRGAALGSCTTSDSTGGYTLTVPAGSGALWVEATGGSYTDEATGAAATLPPGSPLRTLTTATGGTVRSVLTPLTTLALNDALARLAAGSTLDGAGFAAAATRLLRTFGLPAGLAIGTATPTFGAGIDSYGTALTVVSRMVAAGTPLATLLATVDPATLAAAYAAAAAPTPPAPPAPPPPTGGTGGGTASGSISSTGGVETFVPRSNPGVTSPVFTATVAPGVGLYSFYSYLRGADSAGNSSGVAVQGFNLMFINGSLSSLTFIEGTFVRGFSLGVTRFCNIPCAGATVTPSANGLGLTVTLTNARFEVSQVGTTLTPAPTEPIVMNGTLTGEMLAK